MATPTTLLEFATAEESALKKEKVKAQKSVKDAQEEQAAARATHNSVVAELTVLENQAANIRKELASVPTPADGDALLDQLEQKIIDMRAKQAAILAAEEIVEVSKAKLDRANVEINLVAARLGEAEAVLAEAKQQSKQREDLKKKLTQPPLATLKDDADAALNTPPHNKPFTDAKARIKDIPADLITRAQERLKSAVDQLALTQTTAAEAQELVNAELNTNGGLAGKTEKLRVEFLRAEEAFRNYVLKSKEMFDQARAMLALVANPDHDPLTAAQVERIKELEADGILAAPKEKERDDARAEEKAKEAALAKAKLKAQVKDIDADLDADPDVQAAMTALNTARAARAAEDQTWNEKEAERDAAQAVVNTTKAALDKAILKAKADKIDPDTDAAVQAARAALADAEKDFNQADDDYKASDKGILHSWEAAVPNTAWRRFADFTEAERLLTILKDTDPATLVSAMETAEMELFKELVAAAKSARTLRLLNIMMAERKARLEYENGAAQRLMFSALRGDS
ncbi:MAG: hypothetical protein H0T92_13895 [Pyrinomonadaceae bacterium]|nr:hypothetical protein [Pyrinomonadaceae bacterium]